MVWKEKCSVTLREEFVLEALEPKANMAALCRKYGISRKTGYKWLSRFKTSGRAGLNDRSRRPNGSSVAIDGELVLRILELRRDHPRWGPKKLRVLLARTVPDEQLPSPRTIGRILRRAGLTRPRRRKGHKYTAVRPPAPVVEGPNDLWTVDLKGSWTTQDGSRVEPLTVRDDASRFVLAATLLPRNTTEHVQAEFERLFLRYGLPKAIQVDNGTPFAHPSSRGGLTRLSAWWTALGITLHRSRPGKPQDNGGHERMHLDLRYGVEDTPCKDRNECAKHLELWRHEFNNVRPHESLANKTPASLYSPSKTRPRPIELPTCPEGYTRRKLTKKGFLSIGRRDFYVSEALAGRHICVCRIDEDNLHLIYYDIDLGNLTLDS